MGRRGTKNTPTALKIARGNPGHRAINHEEPELAPVADATPPAGLPKRALAEWKRLAPELIKSGVLTVGDLDTFETYCRLVADCVQVEALVKKHGIQVSQSQGYTGLLIKLRAQKKQYAAELGLTPSSRSGVKKVKVADPADARRARFFSIAGGAPDTPAAAVAE